MTDALPTPSAVANLQSADGSVTLSRVRGGRSVDLSVPSIPPALTYVSGTLGGDVAVPAGVPTDVGLDFPTVAGDVWDVTVTINFLPGAATTTWAVQLVPVDAHSTLTGGAQSAGFAVIGGTDVNLDQGTVTFRGLWTSTAPDILKVQVVCTGGDGTIQHHDDDFTHPCTGFVALRLASA